MGLPDNIKRLREERGYTQAELGGLVGVAQQVIADYEGGKYRPSIETGVRLANALGTTVEQLLDSGDAMKDERRMKSGLIESAK